ncbi:hypothetical protein FNF27_07615 [Cafeteria roenbergensis]|uniref:Coiled-coil domain-containing protein 86 n=1 Tax=Cafeteria roenbergensis TaxID=33653 RepID=A0A5A8D4Y8_CAFRO|nr:hypothetical protein FNF31_04604 [Cafeteria roenbergensis]KAA0162572.1 hypothetical protein FNF28_04665 [Cafeteria roenbergensis]KAA0165607.1 hypothetical protein FNF27_07615 [Cafeteria roenbergensis]
MPAKRARSPEPASAPADERAAAPDAGMAKRVAGAAHASSTSGAPEVVRMVPDAAARAKALFLKTQRERAAAIAAAAPKAAASSASSGGAGSEAAATTAAAAAAAALATRASSTGGVKPWKRRQAARTSAATRPADNNAGNKAWRSKVAARTTRKYLQDLEREAKEEMRAKKAEERAKREAKALRKAENEMRSTTFQVLSNADKIKQMNKKQLRQVKKTVVNAKGSVELVSPWE